MVASFLLALREGLEAALILGIVLSVLVKMQRRELIPLVWSGVGLAALVSLLGAGVLIGLGAAFEGRAEEIFEGITMLLAAGILTWMIFWMSRQARGLRSGLEADVRMAALTGGKATLFLLAFFAVGREGLELALFLVATGFTTQTWQIIAGAVLGLALAGILGWLLYTTTSRLNLQRFFLVTNVLLLFFAAGLVAHGVHEFNEAGLLPNVIEHVWDMNSTLDENSFLGQILVALFGYNGNPSLTEVVAYWAYFLVVGVVIWRNMVWKPLPSVGVKAKS